MKHTRQQVRQYTRREILKLAAAGFVSGAALPLAGFGLSGCGKIATPLSLSDDGVYGVIDDNHLHTAFVPSETLRAGVDMDLDIRGTSEHPHWIRLTGEDLMNIQAGKPVSKISTRDWGHSHEVRFNV